MICMELADDENTSASTHKNMDIEETQALSADAGVHHESDESAYVKTRI